MLGEKPAKLIKYLYLHLYWTILLHNINTAEEKQAINNAEYMDQCQEEQERLDAMHEPEESVPSDAEVKELTTTLKHPNTEESTGPRPNSREWMIAEVKKMEADILSAPRYGI